eukprot:g16347.t1
METHLKGEETLKSRVISPTPSSLCPTESTAVGCAELHDLEEEGEQRPTSRCTGEVRSWTQVSERLRGLSVQLKPTGHGIALGRVMAKAVMNAALCASLDGMLPMRGFRIFNGCACCDPAQQQDARTRMASPLYRRRHVEELQNLSYCDAHCHLDILLHNLKNGGKLWGGKEKLCKMWITGDCWTVSTLTENMSLYLEKS